MAWNEPNNNSNDRDPWGKGKQNPPDLDEILRNIKQKLSRLFTGNTPKSVEPTPSKDAGVLGFGLMAVLVIIVWFLSGIFIVDPAEQAVVLRFGKYLSTVGPGPHWIPRFIDSKYIMDVQKVEKFTYMSQMLTKDENIVSVTIAIQYRTNNPKDFLFNIVNPLTTIQQATASALRQVIGHNTLDDILTTGRQAVRAQVEKQLGNILDFYKAGIEVTTVALQSAKAPDEVKAAFDDAIKAQEDEQRYINQAQAYARGVEPIAQGHAKRIFQEAEAYKEQAVFIAKGRVVLFLALLPQYLQSPELTRERMYIDTIESVLSKTTKVLLNINQSNNVIYLPLDRMIQQQQQTSFAQFTPPNPVLKEESTNKSDESSSIIFNRPGRDSDRSSREEEKTNDGN